MIKVSKRLCILGAGGHGKVVADAASRSEQWSDIVFLDDRSPAGALCEGWAVVGTFSDVDNLVADDDEVVVALGSNLSRRKMAEKIDQAGLKLATVIHPHATVSEKCSIAPGTVVLAGSTIAISARVGACCIVNNRASIDHDCDIGDYCHISPGVHIGGTVSMGDHCWVGIGASISNNITLGADVTVGAGAAVVRDVASKVTVVGVPARPR